MKDEKNISSGIAAPRLVILGAAESGVGAALLASKKGYTVFVTDLGKIKDEYKRFLQKHGIAFDWMPRRGAEVPSLLLHILSRLDLI